MSFEKDHRRFEIPASTLPPCCTRTLEKHSIDRQPVASYLFRCRRQGDRARLQGSVTLIPARVHHREARQSAGEATSVDARYS